jgi:ribonuclease III
MSSNDKHTRPPTAALEEAFGVPFDPELLERALTHRSYAYENGGLPTNERLEFLGDSVLGVVVTSALFHNHPDLPEGQLAKLRASVVNMHALADVARSLGPHGLGPYLLLGKGEESTGGRDKASILADTLEALLGAIYLQHGLDTAAEVVRRLFDPLMAESAGRGAALDWKTSLQELTAALGLGVPDYVIDDTGPDHAKTFTAWVVVAGQRYGGSDGRSKKQAEQRAAAAAWRTLTERSTGATPLPAVSGGGHADPATAEEARAVDAGAAPTAGAGAASTAEAAATARAGAASTARAGAAATARAGAARTAGAGRGRGARAEAEAG